MTFSLISITIPVQSGRHLRNVIERIRQNDFSDYEIIVNISEGTSSATDIANEFGCRIVFGKFGLLSSRYRMHEASRGDHELLLDETRLVSKNLLRLLDIEKTDMIVIPETEIGSSILAKVATIDKNIDYLRPEFVNPFELSYVIPRYFRKKVLGDSFTAIRRKLSSEVFEQVIYLDHLLIYIEAYAISGNLAILKGASIEHLGDSNIHQMWEKYKRYGNSARVLQSTFYENLTSFKPHIRRRNPNIKDAIAKQIMLIAHSIPYFIGYWLE